MVRAVHKKFSSKSIVTSEVFGGGGRVYVTGAQKWHIVSLLGDVTSPTTVAYYVSITCSEHREALTVAPIADGVHLQAIRVQG